MLELWPFFTQDIHPSTELKLMMTALVLFQTYMLSIICIRYGPFFTQDIHPSGELTLMMTALLSFQTYC